jgi:hypothetical protein
MTMPTRRPVIRDRKLALLLGAAAYIAGSLLLYDAYERHGQHRPFALHFLPGP